MAEKRTTYHHGDLRAALVTAGIGLARDGGPQAVVLREVARIVGVAPNSAYGHFKTLAALKSAVTQRAQSEMGAAMSVHLDAAPLPDDPREAAKARLREVGRSYIRFALDEPGLFRTAMGGSPIGLRVPGSLADAPDGPEPDTFLLHALTRLIEVGYLDPADLGRAVTASWALVHGLSIMFLDLLAPMTEEQRQSTIDDALDVLVAGLTAPHAR
ncbi:AcrR family transcriptional regulator [Catenuloplanes nepalensis]|uniref:AcrR family transcriptional regulator n=1 Tax=Catenuloplanes nepalensis TaxID=587533 RepID=A0ABT9MZG1_9ACTN|nr:TetR-like C-terminal domain-containing protein [Catenuloplanes nepalensis]MDP9796416.1 AcrR family transcriptional regulator [Catenuloplanes nepalensis]